MLHLLMCLSALSLLAGVVTQEPITDTSVLNISSCPYTFYGQTYEQIYVNTSSDKFAICLNGFYDPQTRGNCIVGPSLPNKTVSYFIFFFGDYIPFLMEQLPAIQTPLECVVYVLAYSKTNYFQTEFLLCNFGRQTALLLYEYNTVSLVYDVQLNGITVDTLNVTDASFFGISIIDTSGCKHSGVLYKHGTVVSSDPETCYTLICDETALLRNITSGPLERCQGNGISMLDTTCSVTGPAVIDFYGQLNFIQDRCAYSLLSVPDLHVMANFRERRRKDVSFVDSVTLTLNGSGVVIHLEQGGVVQLDNTTLTLNSSAQLVHGVELSKDQTGVTAKVSLSNYTASVFFDGYTAQIQLKGPAGEDPSPFSGLCVNSSVSLSELRLSNYSGCEILYNDTADSTINCTLVTQRCNLLKEAPFTACNSLIDPEPYIAACTHTLCNYPSVDELNCQFPEAYSRACSLLSNSTVGDWWSAIGCSPPQAFCQDRICSSHEFCGENIGDETGCFCRALFAAKYSSTGALGDPTVCSHNSASLTLIGCLLVDNNIDYSTLHLNDQTCVGQMDELTHMVTFSFDSTNTCGAVITANNSQMIYRNTITNQNSSDIIVHHDQVYISFSCFYTQPDLKSMSFRIKTNSVIQHIASGDWYYTLTMQAYTDAARTQAVESSTEELLDQRIWVELKTDGLDGIMVAVVTDSCWATSEPSPSGSLRYDLVMNGCANPSDQTVQVQGNGLGTSNYFSFNLFQFSGHSSDIYLHCKLQLCVKLNNNCVPVCNRSARRRRSARRLPKYVDDAAAFITMAWTN